MDAAVHDPRRELRVIGLSDQLDAVTNESDDHVAHPPLSIVMPFASLYARPYTVEPHRPRSSDERML